MARRKIRDGDVYHWHYKDASEKFMPYHCKSRIAIARDGKLYDTFWSNEQNPLIMKGKIKEFQGNINDMKEIYRGDEIYYRREDVVDMAHSNSSRAKIYIKPNVERDDKTISELIASREEYYEREIKYAKSNLDDLKTQRENVENGNLNDVWVPCIRS